MNKFKFFGFLVLCIISSCSNDENTAKTPEIQGELNLTKLTFNGNIPIKTKILNVENEYKKYTLEGTGKSFDVSAIFQKSPNKLNFSGSFDTEIKINDGTDTINETIPITNISNESDYYFNASGDKLVISNGIFLENIVISLLPDEIPDSIKNQIELGEIILDVININDDNLFLETNIKQTIEEPLSSFSEILDDLTDQNIPHSVIENSALIIDIDTKFYFELTR